MGFPQKEMDKARWSLHTMAGIFSGNAHGIVKIR
jgi:hypothetical protein